METTRIDRIEVMEFGGPEKLVGGREPAPRAPLAPGQLRVRIHRIGVNRADLLLREGRYHVRDLPAVPGFEASGVVVESRGAIPEGAPVLVFDRGPGLYRTEAVIDERLVIRLPGGTPMDLAAALPVNWLSAHYALSELARIRAGETALITAAASGVGLAAIQLAKARGARVIAAASRPAKLEAALQAGADQAIELRPGTDLEAETLRRTGGRGAEVALDVVGGALFRPTLRSLAPFGRLVALANVTTEDSVVNTRDFYPRNASILGFQLGALLASGRWEPRPALEELARGVVDGRYRPVIHRVFGLGDAELAHRELESREVIGKILLASD